MPKPKVQPKRTEPYRASVFIPADAYLRAKALADREQMSLSAFVARCVQRAIGKTK